MFIHVNVSPTRVRYPTSPSCYCIVVVWHVFHLILARDIKFFHNLRWLVKPILGFSAFSVAHLTLDQVRTLQDVSSPFIRTHWI